MMDLFHCDTFFETIYHVFAFARCEIFLKRNDSCMVLPVHLVEIVERKDIRKRNKACKFHRLVLAQSNAKETSNCFRFIFVKFYSNKFRRRLLVLGFYFAFNEKIFICRLTYLQMQYVKRVTFFTMISKIMKAMIWRAILWETKALHLSSQLIFVDITSFEQTRWAEMIVILSMTFTNREPFRIRSEETGTQWNHHQQLSMHRTEILEKTWYSAGETKSCSIKRTLLSLSRC